MSADSCEKQYVSTADHLFDCGALLSLCSPTRYSPYGIRAVNSGFKAARGEAGSPLPSQRAAAKRSSTLHDPCWLLQPYECIGWFAPPSYSPRHDNHHPSNTTRVMNKRPPQNLGNNRGPIVPGRIVEVLELDGVERAQAARHLGGVGT